MNKTKSGAYRLKKSFSPEEVKGGFSDAHLEELCEPDLGRFNQAKFGVITGREPYWAAELYSFGRGLRMLAGLPQWLPLPANLDHGIDYRTQLVGAHETQRSRYFLSSQRQRARAEDRTNKKIHLTLHPMVALRISLGILKLPTAEGTLIFPPHSLPELATATKFSDSMEEFLSLPPEFHPLILCIQMRDIERGLHRELRRFKLPIVSAGDVNNRWFGDRFYSILRNFRYSSSTVIGSHTFLSQEMGVDFFLTGDAEIRRIEKEHNHKNVPGMEEFDHRTAYWERLFSEFPPRPSFEKDQLLDYTLGTGEPFSVHRRRLRWLFLSEYLLNFSNMFAEGLSRLANRTLGRRRFLPPTGRNRASRRI